MRVCSKCGAEDKPYFERLGACICGADKRFEEHPSPEFHAPNCKAIGHEVVQYPVRLGRAEIYHDSLGRPMLGSYYTQQGWALMQDGPKCYRVKTLCRNCIVGVEETLQRKREYERLCKAARGEETQTYAQFIAQQ